MKRRLVLIVSTALAVIFCILPIFSASDRRANSQETLNGVSAEVDFGLPMSENSAKSAILIDGKSKNVISSKNSKQACGMASTTKIMTALVAIENCEPEREFLMPHEAIGVEGSSVYLTENEPLTMRELLYCLMLESGNDAAAAIAICCAGSIEGFVKLMNERADEIGLENTHFCNPHGLSDVRHKTTAYDLAMITATAYEYPLFREIVSTKRYRVRYDGIEGGRHLVNHNKLLFGYDGAVGVKTGYTIADGKCLVSAAERDGLLLIAVTLHDNSPTATHRRLLDEGFDKFEQMKIASPGELSFEIPIENGVDSFLTVCNMQEASVCLPKGAEPDFEIQLPQSIDAPIGKGEIVGRIICKYGDSIVYIINLESQEEIEEIKKSLFDRLFGR